MGSGVNITGAICHRTTISFVALAMPRRGKTAREGLRGQIAP